MKLIELTKREIQEKEIEILDYVAKFCEKENINYILSDGTLLGAIRHKGFIPWDLDIDISMLRPDYEKFIKKWNQENHELYSLVLKRTDNDPLLYAKIVDSSTLVYDSNFLTIGGLWIDIFPLDGVPNDEKTRDLHYSQLCKYFDDYLVSLSCNFIKQKIRSLFARKLNKRLFNQENTVLPNKPVHKITLKKFRKFLKPNIFSLFFGKVSTYAKKVNDCSLEYSTDDCTNITNNMAIYRRPPQRKFGYDKSIVTNFYYGDFEDRNFRIPKDYDSLLKSYYGDYMKLPPKEQQIDTHDIIVFWNN